MHAIFKERRKRSAIVLAATISLALALSWFVGPGSATDGPLDRLSNIVGLLKGRSPGERANVLSLSKSKQSGGDLADELQERVLGKVFPEETFLDIPAGGGALQLEDLASLELPTGPFAGDTPVEAGPGLTSLGSPTGAFAPGAGGGLAVGGPGAGPGGIGGGGDNAGGVGLPPAGPRPNLPTPSVAAPVPEPSTWAMMIVGMGLAAAALRRRRSSGSPRQPKHALAAS